MSAINLRAARLDLAGTVGDDVALVITVTDDEAAAVDLSGFTIQADVYRGGVAIATFGDAVSGAGSNILTLTLTDTQTGEIGNERDLTWSLSMTASGSTKQWVAGDFELKPPGYPGTASSTAAALTVYDSQQIALAVVGVSLAGGGGAAVLDEDDMVSNSDTQPPSQQSTVAYIAAQLAALVDAAPGALDTLNELAAALGDDANFASTVTTSLAGKQPLDSDLTAIAALTTTAYGRAILELADQAALMALVQAASTTASGKVELATTAETETGTDTTRAVTPDGLHDMTTLAGAAWFLDEDAMTSNSATKTASQQSIKAYADTKQPLDADLTSIAALTTTSYGRALLELADQAALKTATGFAVQTYTEATAASATRPITGGTVLWINTDAGTTDPTNGAANDVVVKGV